MTLIQLQDAVIVRLTKQVGGVCAQTRAAAWRFFSREMRSLGFTEIQIGRAYTDAQDMAYLNKLCAGELD